MSQITELSLDQLRLIDRIQHVDKTLARHQWLNFLQKVFNLPSDDSRKNLLFPGTDPVQHAVLLTHLQATSASLFFDYFADKQELVTQTEPVYDTSTVHSVTISNSYGRIMIEVFSLKFLSCRRDAPRQCVQQNGGKQYNIEEQNTLQTANYYAK